MRVLESDEYSDEGLVLIFSYPVQWPDRWPLDVSTFSRLLDISLMM